MRKKLDENNPEIKRKINKSLNLSIKEGSFAMGMYGLGTSYFAPYAIALKATASQIGFLNALVWLLPSLIQLKASRLIEKFRRKTIVNISIILQNLMFIPIIIYGIFFSQTSIWILIVLIALFYGLGAAAGPAWFSWMGSLVPENQRGRYFAKRNKITGFFGLIFMIAGALILDKFKHAGMIMLGFGILFSLAFIFRLISISLLYKQYEPKIKVTKRDYFSLWQFLKKAPKTPFGRFVFFDAIFRIAVNIAGPFFAVYMLTNLGFSYIIYMVIVISATIFQLIILPVLGKVSDRFGNITLLKLSTLAVSIIPFLWIISPNPIYLILVPQLVSGLGWAGFTLSTNNYIYDSVKEEKRGIGITYFNLLSGLGMFIGASIGGSLALLNINFMNNILFIFLISGILRFLVASILSRSLQEVRKVRKFNPQFILKEFHPVRGLIKDFNSMNHEFTKTFHFIR